MRKIGSIGLAAWIVAAFPMSGVAAEPLFFQFEQQAQQHCPTDIVVWAEPAVHRYNVKSERFYGATTSGAFMCLQDGEKAGYRARRSPTSGTAG